MSDARQAALVGFLETADRLKHVLRRARTPDAEGAMRRENSAEHSWHVALFALLLHRELAAPPDLGHVLALIAAHDLVEIEAGDTFAYDTAGRVTQEARERAAADALFGALPADVGTGLRALWEEFEAGATPEARFAVACDRLQGFFQNILGAGIAWREGGVTKADTLKRMAPAIAADPIFAALVAAGHARAAAEGLLLG